MRTYSDTLTAEVNRKGVLDIDTVKGCELGMAANPDGGCYGACYAAATARFRGLDFSLAVTRDTDGRAHAASIERAVRAAPFGFFRVGTMGDPSHDWRHTAEVVRWLAPYAVPVVVTKHWRIATDWEFSELVAVGAVLNTSVSALDTKAQLAHRKRQIGRYAELGGVSVARIVSCEFNTGHPEGRQMDAVQRVLFNGPWPIIDNPLRLPRSHALVAGGVVKVQELKDISTVRTISVSRRDAYIGHCAECVDRCGLLFTGPGHPKPEDQQLEMRW